MARSRWITDVAAPLGLVACWSTACSGGLPEDSADYEVITPREGSDAGSSRRGRSSDDGSDPALDAEDRTAPATANASEGSKSALPRNTVLLDGKPMTITASEAHVNRYGAFYTVDFTGENAPPETRIIVSFHRTGSGCVSGADAQQLFLYPAGSSSNAFRSTDGPACGLEITAVPTEVGTVAAGTFTGTLEGVNGVAGKTRTLELAFEVKSIAQP
jgi:hypothetical protein